MLLAALLELRCQGNVVGGFKVCRIGLLSFKFVVTMHISMDITSLGMVFIGRRSPAVVQAPVDVPRGYYPGCAAALFRSIQISVSFHREFKSHSETSINPPR